MLSNSEFVFSDLAKALYRAALYVSYADLIGGEKSFREEFKALTVFLTVLHDQSSEEDFLSVIASIGLKDIENIGDLEGLPAADIENIKIDLAQAPEEVEAAMVLAVNNFSKSEARLYADMLISASASVGQSFDEKDDMFLTGSTVVDAATFLTNAGAIFNRILMFFNDLHASDTDKYLYDEKSVFDQMKISTKENDALADITRAIRTVWLSKYPEDAKQTVQEYIEQNS